MCTDVAIIVTKSIFRKDLRGETIILHSILEWMNKRRQKGVLEQEAGTGGRAA